MSKPRSDDITTDDLFRLAVILLDSDEGLSEEQYLSLMIYVNSEIGEFDEVQNLWRRVDATDGRFYLKEAA